VRDVHNDHYAFCNSFLFHSKSILVVVYSSNVTTSTAFIETMVFVFTPHSLFLTLWYGSAAACVIVPLIVFGASRLQNDHGEYNSYYQQNQEGAQQEYYYRYKKCEWYQFGCSDWYNPCYQQNSIWNRNNGQNGENQNNNNEQCRQLMEQQDQNAQGNGFYGYNANYKPWWYLWAEDERRTEQVNGVNPTLVVIYAWTLCVIGFMLLHGHKTIVFNANLDALSASLFIFANCSFLSMLYLGALTGAIEDDGEAMKSFGWYGQFGVLLYMTHMFCVAWGGVYFIIVRGMILSRSSTKMDVTPSDYLPYKEEKQSLSSSRHDHDELGSQTDTPPIV
jgi:hypothetical protein